MVKIVKNFPALQETHIQSLRQEDPLKRRLPTPIFLPTEFHGKRNHLISIYWLILNILVKHLNKNNFWYCIYVLLSFTLFTLTLVSNLFLCSLFFFFLLWVSMDFVFNKALTYLIVMMSGTLLSQLWVVYFRKNIKLLGHKLLYL